MTATRFSTHSSGVGSRPIWESLRVAPQRLQVAPYETRPYPSTFFAVASGEIQ
jgi:hypothetical protein